MKTIQYNKLVRNPFRKSLRHLKKLRDGDTFQRGLP